MKHNVKIKTLDDKEIFLFLNKQKIGIYLTEKDVVDLLCPLSRLVKETKIKMSKLDRDFIINNLKK